jgi:tetratricopeptide (TPR) repeat protein
LAYDSAAMRRFLALFFLPFLALAARAQSVHWEGSPDDPAEVQLVFEDCAPDGDPQLPVMAETSLTLTGNSTQTSIMNGSFSRSTILTYSARARRAGATLQIPAFTVQTNKGPKPVASYTGGAARVISDSMINARLVPGSRSVWAGEVFSLTYVIDAARRSFSQLASPIDWNASPLIVEDWSKPEPFETNVNDEARLNIIYKARAYAKTSGALTLNPTTQLVNIATGSVGFSLFQQQRVEQLTVNSKRVDLTVNPLPPPPPGFTGAVGQFKLISKVVPTTAAVGEPITWTLELSGTGNWPDIAGLPQREVSKDFQVVQPQAKRVPADGKLFDVTLTEDVVLVPSRPGTYPLKPVTFVYFDPKAGEYRTLTTAGTTVTITAAATPAGSAPRFQVGPPETPASTPAATATPRTDTPPTAPPEGIPRDALPGSDHAPVPLRDDQLLPLLAAPFVLLLVFWGGLAVRRARRTDPRRIRREAHARLAATLARLRSAGEADRPALLLAWQHDSAILWEILHAAPPPAAFGDAGWSQLWVESDRALYRADTALPADWVARAEAALAAHRVPGFSPLAALLPRNLVPFFMLAAVATIATSLRAADASAAYRSGDFATAEKAWTAEVAQDPANPVARYNLSLALAQQDRWDLALAHATAALVQAPDNEPIRWQFALAAEKSGFLPAPLVAFPRPGPLQSLAELASPGAWQRWLLAAAAGAALSLGLLLYSAYGWSSALRSWCAVLLLGASALVAAAALLGLHAYGQTADARAVILWRGSVLRSIPTEADITQKTTTLSAGSVAIVDKTFLSGNWVRLSFDNGQTGWVRKEDVVGLWR